MTAGDLTRLARELGVGITALAERLPNAGLMSRAQALALIDDLGQQAA